MSDEKYRAILERDPTDTQAFVALCNSAARNNDYQYLAQLYDFRAQVIKDTKEIADLYFKEGEIYVDKLDKLPEACEAFLKGFEADKTHAGIGDRLDDIYRDAGDWESALQISEQRLDALTVADSTGTKTVIRSDLHQQTGEIWEKVYSDRKKALAHYKRAIELDKTNILALYGAREIYFQAGKYKNAAKLCELEGRAEKDKERRCALYRELAHLYETRLSDVRRAVVALKRALKASPKSKEVQAELARLISGTPLNEENVKDHEWATEFLIRQAAELSGQPAMDLLTSAILSTPTSERAVAFLESKADESGDFRALARAYETVLEQMTPGVDNHMLVKQLVAVYQTRLNDSAAAAKWAATLGEGMLNDEELTPAQPVDINKVAPPASVPPLPTDSLPPSPISASAPPAAPTAGDSEYPEPEKSPAVPGSLVPPKPAPGSLVPPMPTPSVPGSVSPPMPSPSVPAAPVSAPPTMPAPAEETFTSEESVYPDSIPAPVIPQAGHVPVQEAGMSDEAFSEELRLAADRSRRAGDDATAEQCLLQVLEMFPHDQKAITYLERRFRARSDWLSLRDLLLRSAGAPHLPQAVQTVRLREAARLSEEQLNDVTGAIEAWKVIKSNDPKVRDATDALIRLLGQAEQWEELLEILEQEAKSSKSRTKKLEAYSKMAEIYHLHIRDMEAAAAAYDNILNIDADDMQAMAALEDIYSQTERFEEAILLLRKRANLTGDKAERRDLLFRAATLQKEKLGRAEEAYNTAKEVLGLFKDDLEVLTFLASLDEEAGQWSRLMKLLDHQISLAQPGDKVGLYRKKADVGLNHLDDSQMAVEALNALLEVAEDDLDAMDTLIGIHKNASDWEPLVGIIRKKLETVVGREEQLELRKELARVLENELNREEEAMLSWRAVLEIEADTESLGALARFYERNEKWDDFASVIEQQAAYAEDHKERADILFNRASIIYDKLQDEPRAVGELKRILDEVDPTHDPTMNLLIQIWVEKEQYEEAVEMMDQRISYVEDNATAKKMMVTIGEWCKTHLNDLPRAMESFERAVQLDKDDSTVLNALDGVYTELGEWDKLLKLLYARAKSTGDDEAKLSWLSRGAVICEEELKDNAKAWTWNVEMLERLSHLEETVPKVEEAARRMGLWKELIDLAAAMTRKAQSNDEQVVWWLKAADVFEEKMSDPAQALEAVLRAFGLTPDNEELLDRVDHLAVKVQNWQRLGTVYGVLVKRADEKERKIELLKRYASVLLDKAERPADAFDIIVKAFELEPKDDGLLARVEEIGKASGRWDDLVRIYNGCAGLYDKLEDKIDLKLKAASVFRDDKVDPDGALVTLLEALRLDPFDDEVVTPKVWEEVDKLEADLVPTEAGTYWNKLIESYRIFVEEHKSDKVSQAKLIYKIAEVYVDKLDDIAAAFEAMKENQGLNPRDESTIDSLEELAAKNNYWDALVDHYQDILDETFEMDVAIMLHKRRARILENELDRGDEAAEHYWQIIQLDSSSVGAYEKLIEFYEKAKKWNELVNLLERQLDNTKGKEDKRPILYRIAEIWENEIGNRFEATDWYGQIVSKWPEDEKAMEALERLRKEAPKREEDDELDDIVSSMPAPYFEDEPEDEPSTPEVESSTSEDDDAPAETSDGDGDDDDEADSMDSGLESNGDGDSEEDIESESHVDSDESDEWDDATLSVDGSLSDEDAEEGATHEMSTLQSDVPETITVADDDSVDMTDDAPLPSLTLPEDDALFDESPAVDPVSEDDDDLFSDDDGFEIEEEEALPPLMEPEAPLPPAAERNNLSSAPPPPPPPAAVRSRPAAPPVAGGVKLTPPPLVPPTSDDED